MDVGASEERRGPSRRALLAGGALAVALAGLTGLTAWELEERADGRSRHEPEEAPVGYPSVAQMLATSPFYVAHRGGSLDWPEMSAYAYQRSVSWGVGALEVSLNRTRDGVWVGIHDATLDRTSGTQGFVVADHTWAQVQKYQITAAATNDPQQPSRPYLQWHELVEAYHKTHVLFVDPKAAASHAEELLTMMDSLPGSPTTRMVAKYYGVSTEWADLARSHGYPTWGYFYQADVPKLAEYQGRWDILGMDYTADAAAWAAITSYGKPVIGHICPNAEAVATARARGAHGLVVSGVLEGVPKPSQ